MLIEVSEHDYCKYFPFDPHSFISEPFIELNKLKVERIIRLVNDNEKKSLGVIAGVKDNMLLSPFSAPFGGFHFRNTALYMNEIDDYLTSLQSYISTQKFKGIEIILPPFIYNSSINTKIVNSLIRNGFQQNIPDITNWINLQDFAGEFAQKNSRESYRQAKRNGLSFKLAKDETEKESVYNLIVHNRTRFGRPIHMTLNDLTNTGNLWPVDYFMVLTKELEIVASAIFYRNHPQICYAVFWGDNDNGRPLKAMNFLALNLWNYYKELGFNYIDLGTSSEYGIPNIGLLRFKESHEAMSSLRYSFFWNTAHDK